MSFEVHISPFLGGMGGGIGKLKISQSTNNRTKHSDSAEGKLLSTPGDFGRNHYFSRSVKHQNRDEKSQNRYQTYAVL